MNLQQTKIILAKINTLYKNISLDADNISSIERDLMLNYVRKLYESILEEGVVNQGATRVTQTATPVIVKDIPAVQEQAVPEKVAAPVRKKPRIVEVPDSIKEYAKPVQKTAEVEVEAEPVAPTPKTATPKPKPKAKKAEHEILFEQKESKDLSDRLAEMPVKDLTKAMGINEKLLTIRELFNDDHVAFDTAINQLNTFTSFDEAKDYLSENLAEKYNWADKSKKKKAQIFIKLIKRRYK